MAILVGLFGLVLYAQQTTLCPSTKEYIRTLEFLRESKVITVSEEASRRVADEISKGCLGSSDRFQDLVYLLKKIGFSDMGTLQTALRFSREPIEVQKNFFDIFQIVYGSELFDLTFNNAYELALAYSRSLTGNLKAVREDFGGYSRFCLSEKKLPRKFCSDFVLEMAQISNEYEDGTFGEFMKLYRLLTEDQTFGMSVRDSLVTARDVLKHGPQAPENFRRGFAYASDERGLKLDNKKALEFAVKMATHSRPRPEHGAL